MKTSSFNQFTVEVSFKSICFFIFSALVLVTSVFAVLKGAEAESDMSKNICVILDIIWVGGLIGVTIYCLFVKKRELAPVTVPVSEPLHQEPEVEYTYIDLIHQ